MLFENDGTGLEQHMTACNIMTLGQHLQASLSYAVHDSSLMHGHYRQSSSMTYAPAAAAAAANAASRLGNK